MDPYQIAQNRLNQLLGIKPTKTKNTFKSVKEADNLTLLEWMQSEDRNGCYLEEPLPPIDYAIETIKAWIVDHEAEIPNHITNIINKY